MRTVMVGELPWWRVVKRWRLRRFTRALHQAVARSLERDTGEALWRAHQAFLERRMQANRDNRSGET